MLTYLQYLSVSHQKEGDETDDPLDILEVSGFLVAERDSYITIAQGLDASGLYQKVLHVPKVCILDMRTIHVDSMNPADTPEDV